MTIAPGIELPEDRTVEICRRYHVRELPLIGSAARLTIVGVIMRA